VEPKLEMGVSIASSPANPFQQSKAWQIQPTSASSQSLLRQRTLSDISSATPVTMLSGRSQSLLRQRTLSDFDEGSAKLTYLRVSIASSPANSFRQELLAFGEKFPEGLNRFFASELFPTHRHGVGGDAHRGRMGLNRFFASELFPT